MKEFDLEERTVLFSESVIDFVKQAKNDQISKSIISQLIRSATSIGANYCEANGASSKKDKVNCKAREGALGYFRNKIHICKKEAKETLYWLRLLARSNSEDKDVIRGLWKEAHELTLIFSKITTTMYKSDKME